MCWQVYVYMHVCKCNTLVCKCMLVFTCRPFAVMQHMFCAGVLFVALGHEAFAPGQIVICAFGLCQHISTARHRQQTVGQQIMPRYGTLHHTVCG